MKAKEWRQKFNEVIQSAIEDRKNGENTDLDEIHSELTKDLLRELDADMKRIKEERHVQTIPGFKSILVELNQKWNAIAKEPIACLQKDGYLKLWEIRLPIETQQIFGNTFKN